jgi:hypothetical protein
MIEMPCTAEFTIPDLFLAHLFPNPYPYVLCRRAGLDAALWRFLRGILQTHRRLLAQEKRMTELR